MRRIRIRVTPRAHRDEVIERDGVYSVRVTVPAEEGKATARALRLLATYLHLPPTSLRLVTGRRSREKTVEVSDTPRHDS